MRHYPVSSTTCSNVRSRSAALIDVADTAFMCLQWFRAQRVAPTADAIVRMAALILQREDAAA
jgi:hypothetical protein